MTLTSRSSTPILFTCPHCQSPLMPETKQWQCDGSLNQKHIKHPFDVARQGYVNLLPVQHKKSKLPGDSQASVESRHRFLHQGFYQPLQQKLKQLIEAYSSSEVATNNVQTLLDVGCGEGYYTFAMAQALQTACAVRVNRLIAVDISKPAVTQLAKIAKMRGRLWYQTQLAQPCATQSQRTASIDKHLTPAIYPMVASAANLPMSNNSVDFICSVFSPILPLEFSRVLRLDGRLIIAKPDVGHLQTVRKELFDDVRLHDSDKFLEDLAPHFKLIKSHQIQASLSLNQQALRDLLTMTPYAYRAKAEKCDALLKSTQINEFKTQAKFVVYELARK